MLSIKENSSTFKKIPHSDDVTPSPEFRISDCSSDEENNVAQPEQEIGPVLNSLITWSSDEDNGKTEKSNSFLNSSFVRRYSTPKKKLYVKRPPLPKLSVKRKIVNEEHFQTSPRRALMSRNNVSSDHKTPTKTIVSPWCKVRKAFTPLHCSISDTISETYEQILTKETQNEVQKEADETQIDWSSSSSSEKGSPTHVKVVSTTQLCSAPTELELMVALIERGYGQGKQERTQVQTKRHSKSKRCIKGGLMEQLQRLRDSKRAERKFLQHDQKLGLQNGVRLRVITLQCTFGVHIAEVEIEEISTDDREEDSGSEANTANTCCIVLNSEVAAHTKVGSHLEAFFDDTVWPYELIDKFSNRKDIFYIQPHKLLHL